MLVIDNEIWAGDGDSTVKVIDINAMKKIPITGGNPHSVASSDLNGYVFVPVGVQTAAAAYRFTRYNEREQSWISADSQTGKGRDAARFLSGLPCQIAPQAAAAPASAAASPAARSRRRAHR